MGDPKAFPEINHDSGLFILNIKTTRVELKICPSTGDSTVIVGGFKLGPEGDEDHSMYEYGLAVAVLTDCNPTIIETSIIGVIRAMEAKLFIIHPW